jgi:hypothetical protein
MWFSAASGSNPALIRMKPGVSRNLRVELNPWIQAVTTIPVCQPKIQSLTIRKTFG